MLEEVYTAEKERDLVATSLAERVSWFRKLGLREHRQVVVRVETHVRVDVIGGSYTSEARGGRYQQRNTGFTRGETHDISLDRILHSRLPFDRLEQRLS